MLPKFICHPDFFDLEQIDLFHKESDINHIPHHPESLKNKHILYRKKFILRKINCATIKITADDYYKLYINNKFVTMGPAAAYPQSYNYNEIDVTRFLKRGENVIAVHTYYQGLINRVWVSGDLNHMLWCELSVNRKTELVSDESWKCTYHTGYTPIEMIGYYTGYTECYDSRSAETSFSVLEYDDASWRNASICKPTNHKLVKQETMQIDVYSRNNEARQRYPEVQACLNSTYADQLQDKYQFRIGIISDAVNLSGLDGGSDINRYTIRFQCITWNKYTKEVDYYTSFGTQARNTNSNIFADFTIENNQIINN